MFGVAKYTAFKPVSALAVDEECFPTLSLSRNTGISFNFTGMGSSMIQQRMSILLLLKSISNSSDNSSNGSHLNRSVKTGGGSKSITIFNHFVHCSKLS